MAVGTLEKSSEPVVEVGSDIARQMSEALSKLTAEKIAVEFSNLQTVEQNTIFFDVPQKCFGCYVNFSSPSPLPIFARGKREGIVVVIFPLSSTASLVRLLLKRFLNITRTDEADHQMKLSAFKEAAGILVLTYINGMANALKVKLTVGAPKFVRLRKNMEFIRQTRPGNHPRPDDVVSIGQFDITGRTTNLPAIRGRFIVIC